jgi:trigger factor
MQAQMRAPIFEEKVVDLILSRAQVTDKPVSKDELMAEDDLPEGYGGEPAKPAKPAKKADEAEAASPDGEAKPKARARAAKSDAAEAKAQPAAGEATEAKPAKSAGRARSKAKSESTSGAE